ncbi:MULTISPECIES: fumarylacetoacetate hydrolase family protein [Chelativorans]|jgi:2-keto-4-pentenoate hydratase/2-oxohepta-3-ene-1,7-dioic acid hydratase in catechol pathway|uniref:Fumarylacetoacetate (FAA) hydrolase n=1 Tax=Chelativorans sp. (strain BNC1) TaxID=266779 RepID=Q11D77_CHESB|nr:MULTISPECIES: fumarylacetoacetate hydrolase family protein [Chelativorans]
MKLACFDGGRIGVVSGDRIVDVTPAAGVDPASWPPVGMVQVIANFERLRATFQHQLDAGGGKPLASVRLECPIAWPNKVVAFPANYHAHIDEMKAGSGLISNFAAAGQGFFLKANSSLSGPADPIVLPNLDGREVHHESELAVIIGKRGRNIPRENALQHVFGYSCLIDAVVRGKEERVMRKSYDTFCPLGPWLVTAEEVPDPANIDIELTVNGEVRQKANTRALIVDVPEMIAMASSVMTLEPGDIIASGTPSGVGPMLPGDAVCITIAGVGEMRLNAVRGEGPVHPVWIKD